MEPDHRTPLSAHLAAAGLTRRDLAERIGVTQAAVSHWCCGEPMTAERAVQIANVLGVPPDELNPAVDWDAFRNALARAA